MSLATLMATDAAAMLSTSEFAETVVYTPRGGSPRSIAAVIDRGPREIINMDGNVYKPMARLTVANDAVSGIASSDTAMVGGTITYAVRPGETPRSVPIPPGNPSRQSAGLLDIIL